VTRAIFDGTRLLSVRISHLALLIAAGSLTGLVEDAASQPISARRSVQAARDAETADRYFQEGNWVEAVRIYREVVDFNPYSGYYWRRYAEALRRLGRYPEAIAASQKAAPLGPQPASDYYFMAATCALAHQTETSLEWLRKALDAKFNNDELLRQDRAFDGLRGDARFQALAGIPSANLDRTDQWRFDLGYLARRRTDSLQRPCQRQPQRVPATVSCVAKSSAQAQGSGDPSSAAAHTGDDRRWPHATSLAPADSESA
jgi:tetratricopeptide (TPR) repeat protein